MVCKKSYLAPLKSEVLCVFWKIVFFMPGTAMTWPKNHLECDDTKSNLAFLRPQSIQSQLYDLSLLCTSGYSLYSKQHSLSTTAKSHHYSSHLVYVGISLCFIFLSSRQGNVALPYSHCVFWISVCFRIYLSWLYIWCFKPPF